MLIITYYTEIFSLKKFRPKYITYFVPRLIFLGKSQNWQRQTREASCCSSISQGKVVEHNVVSHVRSINTKTWRNQMGVHIIIDVYALCCVKCRGVGGCHTWAWEDFTLRWHQKLDLVVGKYAGAGLSSTWAWAMDLKSSGGKNHQSEPSHPDSFLLPMYGGSAITKESIRKVWPYFADKKMRKKKIADEQVRG